MLYPIIVVVVLVIMFLAASIRILNEYERAVIFRLGRIIPTKGPGLIILIPVVDRMVRVDTRTITMDVPSQDVITRDNVSIKVNAVIYFRVVDSMKAIVEVENYLYATSQLAQTTLTKRLRTGGTRRDPGVQGQGQPPHPGDPGPQHRPLGDQGDPRGGEVHRPAAGDAAGHGQAGRGGKGKARQGHRRRGRVPGSPEALRGSVPSCSSSRWPSSSGTCRPWCRSGRRTTRRRSSRSPSTC